MRIKPKSTTSAIMEELSRRMKEYRISADINDSLLGEAGACKSLN